MFVQVQIVVPKMYLPSAPRSPKIKFFSYDWNISEVAFLGSISFDEGGNSPDSSSFIENHILPHTDYLLDESRTFEATVVMSLFFTLTIPEIIQ